ncbi:uncharacterized protein BO95DRAFT_345260, partial [Aspergillus brunneoviolaceus CBS 621.78]
SLASIAPPPHSIITQIPPSALAELLIPSRRSALASDFSKGATPAWYGALPTEVKRYISYVKEEIA